MRDMKNELKSIYDDFYGPTKEKPSIDVPVRRPAAGTERDFVRPAEQNAGPQEIETEVVTQTEFAVQTAPEPEEPKEPEKSGMEELNELIGLKTVKHDVEELVGLAKVRKMREEKGMKAVPVSLHLVFSGNPGTGKTTVARILAKLYKEIGILSTGQLVETDRSGLVAGYVGQTAIKTQKKIQEAMGGVLFIDEAYTLNQEGENYGQEAIDTILKAMEDHRDKFVVIVAGYTDLMKAFIESNPGLKSRFNKFFYFPDYTVDELQAIFMMQCKKYQYKLTEEAEAAVKEEIVRLEAAKGENYCSACGTKLPVEEEEDPAEKLARSAKEAANEAGEVLDEAAEKARDFMGIVADKADAFMKGVASKLKNADKEAEEAAEEAEEAAEEAAEAAGDAVAEAAEAAEETAEAAVDAVEEAAEAAGDAVEEAAEAAVDAAEEAAGAAADAVAEAAETAADAVDEAAEASEDKPEE